MIRKNILSIVFLALVMNGFAQTEEVTVTNLEGINSSKSEFGAVPHGDGLIFTSTNGEKFNGKIDKCNTDDYFAKLFYAEPDNSAGMAEGGMDGSAGGASNGMANGCNGCSFTNAFPISGDVKGKFHDGAPTISPAGDRMIFSRNYPGKSNFLNACNDDKLNLRLMSAEKVGDQWVNVQELPLSGEDFTTSHPAFSTDGQCIFFTSDRPGGVGGMDLYKSCREGDGWSTPMNLGAPINTEGNEVFPYAGRDGNLYFSSNGQAGNLGGLDVYSSSMGSGSWSAPVNLGAPFNSAGDDLGFSLCSDGESGYLTSNRAGGQGGDDIYCWKVNEAPVTLAVEDAATRGRIDNSLVKIQEATQTKDYTTDGNGVTTPDIMYRRMYDLEVDHPGYEYWSKSVSASELASENPYIVPLVKKAFPLGGNVIWEDKSIAPDSRVVLHNLITGDSMVINADADGKFGLDINCIDDYELIAYKEGKVSSKTPLPGSSIDCNGGENAVTLILPKPPPPPAPVCACTGSSNPVFDLPVGAKAKPIRRLGSRPEFGRSTGMSGADFYNKLQKKYNSSPRDARFLDELFQGMGYAGFSEANEYTFTETVLVPGIEGNMGYTSAHKTKYVRLNASGADLEAFRVNGKNGCHIHFMKTCGNHFFFCSQ